MQIVINVDHNGDIEKVGSVMYVPSNITIATDIPLLNHDMLTAILGEVYLMVANQFLEKHRCLDCGQARFHRSNVYRMEHLMKEIGEEESKKNADD